MAGIQNNLINDNNLQLKRKATKHLFLGWISLSLDHTQIKATRNQNSIVIIEYNINHQFDAIAMCEWWIVVSKMIKMPFTYNDCVQFWVSID